MKTDVVVKDSWIVGLLAGVLILESELINAFARSSPGGGVDLRRRIDELNSWAEPVGDALGVRTGFSWRLILRGGSCVTLPVRSPAARSSAAWAERRCASTCGQIGRFHTLQRRSTPLRCF